jgi:hypothetical protein
MVIADTAGSEPTATGEVVEGSTLVAPPRETLTGTVTR